MVMMIESAEPSCHIVWFKRDLRLHDHAALCAAAAAGPVIGLYVFEPDLWLQPDVSGRQWRFVAESLVDLRHRLAQRGGQLVIMIGSMPEALAEIAQQRSIAGLYSHQETGNDFTYQRDLAVATWCHDRQIVWQEYRQLGVIRRLRDRDHWKRLFDAQMADPVLPVPEIRWGDAPALPARCSLEALNRYVIKTYPELLSDDPPGRQAGGRQHAIAVLEDFLKRRSQQYRGGISSPLSATSACSRLSAHLAYGTLSTREVIKATQRFMASETNLSARHRRGIQSFISRLYWQSHFIQKLESQPEIEWANMHRGYDGLRESEWSPLHFERLVNACTGWPLVDACVVMLRETGWLNFRMRAMLVSVASYALWLHWRQVGLWLATQFTDYEPGIHWSQMQMQAGTTGINTTRVYNPIKQAQDHDPKGTFVRQWLPYMRQVPDTWLFEPWRMPDALQIQHGLKPGVDIPRPVVDFEAATRHAKARVYEKRRNPEVLAAKQTILQRHGSRRGRDHKNQRARQVASLARQLDFEFV